MEDQKEDEPGQELIEGEVEPPSREEFEALAAQVRRLAEQVANGKG